jgi:hypothetical protein
MIEACDPGYVNDGYQCLETDLTLSELKRLHERIIEEHSKDTSDSIDEIIKKFETTSDVNLADFRAAVAFQNKYEIKEKYLVRRSKLFSFIRNRVQVVPLRGSTFGIAGLLAVCFVAAVATRGSGRRRALRTK